MMREDKNKKRQKYESLHRFKSGILVTCICVTIIGSVVAGARLFAISWVTILGLPLPMPDGVIGRALMVFIIITLASRMLLDLWASWEEINEAKAGMRSAKRHEAKAE